MGTRTYHPLVPLTRSRRTNRMEIERLRFPTPVSKSLLRFIFCLLALGLTLYGGTITSSNFSSSATVINFDDLTGGNGNLAGPSVTDQYSLLGVTFNDPSYPGDDTADTNLTPYMTDASAPNALFVYQAGMMGQAPAAPFQISFSVPVDMVGFIYASSINAYLEVDVYGANNQLLESLDFTGDSAPIGLEGFAGIQESTPIAQFDISYHLDSDPCRTLNFSIDNLEFQETPEPSTFALIIGGLLGLLLWRPLRTGSSKMG